MSVDYGALKYFSGLSQSARHDCVAVIFQTGTEVVHCWVTVQNVKGLSHIARLTMLMSATG
jgi:hypothetical protein